MTTKPINSGRIAAIAALIMFSVGAGQVGAQPTFGNPSPTKGSSTSNKANAAADVHPGSGSSSNTSKPATAPVVANGTGGGTPASTSTPATPTPTPTTAPAPPPVSSRAQIAVNAARSQLGVPYKFAMSSPGVAFDCSGLTAYAWSVAGISIVHQSALQYASTPHVPITDVQPGDLLFFYHPISHVAIYIGNGQMIHAPAPGKTVMIANVGWADVVGASRPG